MSKKMLVLLVVLITFTAVAHPVAAQGTGTFGEIYVDPTRSDANEDGSKDNPYNDEDEGRAYLQSLPQGGDLYIWKNGKWTGPIAVDPAKPGISGTPLSQNAMYLLLGAVALVLIFAGWFLQKRSRSMEQ